MTLTQSEAEKLARELRDELGRDQGENEPSFKADIQRLCDHILSGDLRREIENAAYRKAAKVIGGCAQSVGEEETIADAQRAIHSLIQPPAQKEDGE